MWITGILNNSALIAVDEKREETILIGKGISFQRKPGEEIDPSVADKQFTRNSAVSRDLLELFENVPEEYFEMTNVIVRYANKKLKGELDKSIYLTLLTISTARWCAIGTDCIWASVCWRKCAFSTRRSTRWPSGPWSISM